MCSGCGDYISCSRRDSTRVDRSLAAARPWDGARTVGPPDGFLLNGQTPFSLLASKSPELQRQPCLAGQGPGDTEVSVGERLVVSDGVASLTSSSCLPRLLCSMVSFLVKRETVGKKHSLWRVQRGKRNAIAMVACQACMATRCLNQLHVHQLLRCHGLNERDAAQAVILQTLATMRRCNVSRGTQPNDLGMDAGGSMRTCTGMRTRAHKFPWLPLGSRLFSIHPLGTVQ